MKSPDCFGPCELGGLIFTLAIAMPFSAAGEPVAARGAVVRCAVVGGLNEIDFWPQLADRFERATGHRLEFVVTGPKHVVAAAFRAGEADAIVMHPADAMINLVADGLAENLQPWARNDYVIVGPASDPAQIRGERDAVAALAKIIASRSKLLQHASGGASELLGELLVAGELELNPEFTLSQPGERHRQMLRRAAAEKAYAIVGRIPFLNGKVEAGDLQIMVQGDARLRRAYLIATTTRPSNPAAGAAARKLSAFLREPATQEFIAEFGKGKYDDRPLLFPVKTAP